MQSINQNKLKKQTLDIMAWIFREQFPANQFLPIPIDAIELKIGGDETERLLWGDDGVHMHGGSRSGEYFHHIGEDDWALVLSEDCIGDADAGEPIAKELEGSRS